MRLSKLYTKTSKTLPADEPSKNAQLLIKAGFIHKEMAGVYSYLPLGIKVINNISQIVREEMNYIDGQEVLISILQSRELWEKTGRWDDKAVDNWFKTRLATGSELGLAFSLEEPLTNSLLPFVNSYKELPLYIYQINTKFRNELRAKSGLMRGREFIMKDLYSYSRNLDEHQKYYERAAAAYMKVYERAGIGDITVRTFASGGVFSKYSDEFQAISPIGEDTIYVDEDKKIAVNKEVLQPEVLKDLGLDKLKLAEKKAVEIGNIFSLGAKYSDALGLYYFDKNDQKQSIIMGCYGIGISRLMGLIAEHFADDKGLVWPKSVAPALVYLVAVSNDPEVIIQADKLYKDLSEKGIEVIYDDRDARVGEKFADADLIGIPYRIVISKSTVSEGVIEVKERSSDESKKLSPAKLIDLLAR